MVKRAGLKIPSLSEFGGSNPLSCIRFIVPVAQPGLEHHTPNVGVAGSNPVRGVFGFSNI